MMNRDLIDEEKQILENNMKKYDQKTVIDLLGQYVKNNNKLMDIIKTLEYKIEYTGKDDVGVSYLLFAIYNQCNCIKNMIAEYDKKRLEANGNPPDPVEDFLESVKAFKQHIGTVGAGTMFKDCKDKYEKLSELPEKEFRELAPALIRVLDDLFLSDDGKED